MPHRPMPPSEPARPRGDAGATRKPVVARFEVPSFTVEPGGGPRRRDRRGRGIRGPLLPPFAPAFRTRADTFDALILMTVHHLEIRWAAALRGVEFAVEDVPASDPAPWEQRSVPLGRCFPADSGGAARIVTYRRPLEARALDAEDLADLVRAVLVEQVAHLLARTPEEIDPSYGER